MLQTVRNSTGRLLAVWDLAAWFIATLAFTSARYDFLLSNVQWAGVVIYPAVAGVTGLALALALRVYQGRSRVGSFEEAMLLAGVVGLVGIFIGIFSVVVVPSFPRGVALTVPVGALVLMAAARLLARGVWTAVTLRKWHASGREGILIYGAGNAGQELARLIEADPRSPYKVVGFIDDDFHKRYRRYMGSRVIGTSADLVHHAAELGVQTVALAMPSASADFLRRVIDRLGQDGFKVLVLPSVEELAGRKLTLEQLQEIDVADILGRGQIRTNLSEVSGYLNSKVVLITGAGGSIGSELARQVHRLGPSKLVLLDRDESGLHSTQLSIYHSGLLDTRDLVLCSIRDKEALDRVFWEHQPDVVFHVAALKHLPLLEMYPDEGWKTNVLGTLNVLECASAHGVGTFVNISTDKASDPTSVLGRTKSMAERLTAGFAERGAGNYVSVRFGNVLGSRGSVLYTFKHQIEAGGPVTVVHPDITRYFMTIPEACQLVIQAGAIGGPGEVLVLDMGEPVRIMDVAERLIQQSGRDIDIIFTGLRPGEKLHEDLFSRLEEARPTSHQLINQVRVPGIEPEEVRGMAFEGAGPRTRIASTRAANQGSGLVTSPHRRFVG